jgi:hypothetical protein
MPVRFQHDQLSNSVYFITFTCYKWKQLFSIAKAYDAVYKTRVDSETLLIFHNQFLHMFTSSFSYYM